MDQVKAIKKVIYLTLVLSMTAIWLLAATAPFAQAAAGTEVLIGDLGDYSGPAKAMTLSVQAGEKLAIEEINAAGGIKSLGGTKLRLVTIDHQMKPELAKEGAERLIYSEKVNVLTLVNPSGFAVMVGKICEEAEVPYSPIAIASTPVIQQGFKTVFRIMQTGDQLGAYVMQDLDGLANKYLVKKPTNLAVLYVDNEWGQDLIKGIRNWAEKLGYKLVADIAYAFPLKDPASYLLKVRAANPDAFLYVPFGTVAYQVRRGMMDMGYHPLTIGLHDGASDLAYIDNLKELAENDLSAGNTGRGMAKDSTAFADKYKAKYGIDPDGFGYIGYQEINFIKAGIEMAKSSDRAAIVKAVRTIDYTSDVGPMVMPFKRIKLDDAGQLPMELATAPIIQVQNGTWVPVWPEVPGVTMKFHKAWESWKK